VPSGQNKANVKQRDPAEIAAAEARAKAMMDRRMAYNDDKMTSGAIAAE
jgi:hypothetical protein